VSPEDGFHVRIGSSTYFEILFDNNEFVELDKNLTLKILCTLLTQRNMQTKKDVMEKTKLKDAVRTGVGKSKGREVFAAGFCLYWWINGCCCR
jgi:acetyl-CoA carboxylase carboxyl transferase subunit beta